MAIEQLGGSRARVMRELKSRPGYIPPSRRDAGQKYIRGVYSWAYADGSPYLSREEEAAMRINVVSLDLESGEAPDAAPRFAEPAPRSQIGEHLQRSQPWRKYNEVTPVRPEDYDHMNPERPRVTAADYMFVTMNNWARASEMPQYHDSPWDGYVTFNEYHPYPLSRRLRPDGSWSLKGAVPSADAALPHVHTLVSHGARMRADDALLRGEVAAAAGLIAFRRCYDGFGGRRYVALTMLSASDRRLRVVQFWHDREEPEALHVRRSRVLEFREGALANMEDWVAAMSWMLSKPLGDV